MKKICRRFNKFVLRPHKKISYKITYKTKKKRLSNDNLCHCISMNNLSTENPYISCPFKGRRYNDTGLHICTNVTVLQYVFQTWLSERVVTSFHW